MKVSDIIINCLEAEGVEYVFGIVGKETLDLADSLSKSDQIQFVNVRHEQGAVLYGRCVWEIFKESGCSFFINVRPWGYKPFDGYRKRTT